MNRVEGKAALITGGGAGIGAATGELVCAEGGVAVLVDANADALAVTMKAIAQRVPGARVSTFAADVADANGLEQHLQSIPSKPVVLPVVDWKRSPTDCRMLAALEYWATFSGMLTPWNTLFSTRTLP